MTYKNKYRDQYELISIGKHKIDGVDRDIVYSVIHSRTYPVIFYLDDNDKIVNYSLNWEIKNFKKKYFTIFSDKQLKELLKEFYALSITSPTEKCLDTMKTILIRECKNLIAKRKRHLYS